MVGNQLVVFCDSEKLTCTDEGYHQVDELDLSKAKATELLKAHDGDAVKAMRAFISVS